jgi:hypothetical protein
MVIKSRSKKMGEAYNMRGKGEKFYKILIGKPKGRRPTGRL